MNITIYAAGPIDLGQDVPNWRHQLMQMLSEAGHSGVMFDPSTAYKQAKWGELNLSRTRYIENVNKVALEEAAFFVVCLPKGVSSVGTPIELDWAFNSAKPILLLTDIKSGSSVYLDNRVPASFWFNADFKDLDSIYQALAAIANRLVSIASQAKVSGYADLDR